MPISRLFLFIASINGFLAVSLGAFGSHSLKEKLSDNMLNTWQTAVQYHFYHTITLLIIALILFNTPNNKWMKIGGWGITAGTILFCGSLYSLALDGPKWLGPITPLGGLCFLSAWACIGIAAINKDPR